MLTRDGKSLFPLESLTAGGAGWGMAGVRERGQCLAWPAWFAAESPGRGQAPGSLQGTACRTWVRALPQCPEPGSGDNEMGVK